jgi:starvation-inducible DNA-binding protein
MKTQEIEDISQQEEKLKTNKLAGSFSKNESIINILNKLLANYSVHYQKLRNFHWNVKGADFFDLHEQFELLYREAHENIDEIAERIRVFGKTPLSTFKDYLAISRIKETGTNLPSNEMAQEVLNDFKILLELMFAVVDVTTEQNDSGTEEMVKVFIHNIEKHHWMLSSFLGK